MANSSQDAVASLIQKLSDSDPVVRESAARALFLHGCDRAAPCLRQWVEDPDLAACFVPSDSRSPQITVGIALNPTIFALVRAVNGDPALADVPPGFDATEFELRFAEGVHLDILTTFDLHGSGAIARFLRRFGEGIQQVELRVHSVDEATELIRTRFGLSPIYPSARPGADATRVNFFLVSSSATGKLLIELVELPPSSA